MTTTAIVREQLGRTEAVRLHFTEQPEPAVVVVPGRGPGAGVYVPMLVGATPETIRRLEALLAEARWLLHEA